MARSELSSSDRKVQIPEAFSGLFDPARYKAYYGGRGSGKSHSFATALVIKGAQQPIRVLCCREVQRSIKDSVKRLLDDKIESLGLSALYQSTDTEIRGANGTLFVFAGLRTNPDTLKSMEAVDIAWVEEAHAVSERSLNILVPTVRQPDSEIWLSWNPTNKSDPVDARFRHNPPPNSIIREVSYADNPWLPDVLREEMEWDRQRDPDKYAHIWMGKHLQRSDARVFHNWRVESFTTPEDVRLYFGADWGFANDPTVLVRCWVDGRTLYVDAEAHAVGCEIDKTPALFDRVPESRRWPITADSARPETISYMQRNGFNIRAAKKGKGSLEEGVEFLKSFDIVVHPDCKHTIDELSLYSYRVDSQTEEVLPQLQDKHNHVIDSLRYAVEGMRRGSGVKTRRIEGLM